MISKCGGKRRNACQFVNGGKIKIPDEKTFNEERTKVRNKQRAARAREKYEQKKRAKEGLKL